MKENDTFAVYVEKVTTIWKFIFVSLRTFFLKEKHTLKQKEVYNIYNIIYL